MHNHNGFSKNPDKYEGFGNLFPDAEVLEPNSRELIPENQDKDPNKPNGMGGHAGRTPNYPNPPKK